MLPCFAAFGGDEYPLPPNGANASSDPFGGIWEDADSQGEEHVHVQQEPAPVQAIDSFNALCDMMSTMFTEALLF